MTSISSRLGVCFVEVRDELARCGLCGSACSPELALVFTPRLPIFHIIPPGPERMCVACARSVASVLVDALEVATFKAECINSPTRRHVEDSTRLGRCGYCRADISTVQADTGSTGGAS